MKLVVESGPCNSELRSWCMGIAIYFLLSITLNVILLPSVMSFIGFVIVVIGNICLLLGCLKSNYILVFVWLIHAACFFIGWPIAVFGTIFHFGGYREGTGSSNLFVALFIYIIQLILYVFCSRIVYSYSLQLKNRNSNQQHSVVI
ncbi:uncharacterized protein LOC115634509 [Scaptodrosophila lebanonensis]|uniref:Uncharacterized protein LOC115634509 n=1 Tax=Drosophila lebanonensis TaxID=7225 RepID=A0A6J2UIW9_DROLE|nr:uncharacterized protein LOC115634509 [Scaptodrosophila lebanonensis]